MNELLGFVVLTGPLFLILLWLPASIWIAFRVTKRFTQPGKKVAAGIGIFILAFLLPFADEIAGRIYFNHLCATQAGVKAYKTVELPPEHWDGEGRPRFYDEKNGNFTLSKDYPTKLSTHKHSSFFHIDKFVGVLRDREKTLISENISYMYWGGWVKRNFSTRDTATSCGNYHEQYGNFIKQVFKPITSK